MTLIELMVVVAIVGILATLAVFMFTKSTAKARASEVPAVFAEFRIKQESYHVENGSYLSTGDENNMSTWWPDAVASPGSGGIDPTPYPTEWRDLRIVLDKTALYCSYVSVGRDANVAPGGVANSFGYTATPAVNYFFNVAECNLDGETGTANNSRYFSVSTNDGIAKLREGQ